MIHSHWKNFRLRILMALIGLALAAAALASQIFPYDGSWYAVAGGGGNAQAGGYAVTGTIGQAATVTMSDAGKTWTVQSGFIQTDDSAIPKAGSDPVWRLY